MYNLSLNTKLYGNEDVIKKLEIMICSNSNNAFIIGGPAGVGKANFIYKLSKFLLCHFEDFSLIDLKNKKKEFLNETSNNKSSHLFESKTHPDFYDLTINQDTEEKKIPINNVRKFNSFFQKTFSVSKIKIGVINTIDDLSINSLNLLLKTIEELPLNTYMFLLSHKPSSILETITSRCIFININPLNNIDFNIFIKENIKNLLHEEILFIKDISNASPGLALSLHEKKIYNLYIDLLQDLLISKKYLRIRETILNLTLSNNKEKNYYLFIINIIIINLFKKTVFFILENKYLETTLNKEKELINIIISKNNILKILNLHSKFDKDMHSADLLNINKSDIINNVFKNLCGI